MALKSKWKSRQAHESIDVVFYLPVLLIYGTIAIIFLGLATLGTSYRASIAQVIEARVAQVVPLCRYELPRVKPEKSRGVHYDLPCSDLLAASKLKARGMILFSKTETKLILDLQEQPRIRTTIVVKNTEIKSLNERDKLAVRVPILRENESVELASAIPLSDKFAKAFKFALMAYAIIWALFLVFYKRIRGAFVRS